MARKAYIADVEVVTDQASAQNNHGATTVTKGSEDGELHIHFTPPSGVPIEIELIALDVGGYPSENIYMITTANLDLPGNVDEVLQEIQTSSAGVRIPALVTTISRKLQRLLSRESRASDASMDEPESDAESSVDMGEVDDYPETEDEWKDLSGGNQPATTKVHILPESVYRVNKRIRSDLRAVKSAGFRVGILDGMEANHTSSIVSISVMVGQLGLSTEALHAWDLEPHQYVVLLIRYSSLYKEFETIMKEPADYAQVDFRTGVCNRYKPTLHEALAAFKNVSNRIGSSFETPITPDSRTKLDDTGFTGVFISGSLNPFMEQLVSLLKIRYSADGLISWAGATKWLNDNQSRIDKDNCDVPLSYYKNDSKPSGSERLESLLNDHLTNGNPSELSFPLIAAQLFLLYLTQCTEYCLVCHEKTQEEFQALKPYVCSKPLCLYQYMSLGFGPSLEHELLTQPYVVDLLVSFCYASAQNSSIRVYPTGMSLIVPPVTGLDAQISQPTPHISNSTPQDTSTPSPSGPAEPTDPLNVKFDRNRQEITFEGVLSCPIRNGEWVILQVNAPNPRLHSGHYQVMDISLYPVVKLSKPELPPRDNPKKTFAIPGAPGMPTTTIYPASLVIYNQNFDDMDSNSKAQTIVSLLGTLPSIKEMRDYLIRQSRYSEPSLRAWKECISPAALGLLRWILASNRSCIMQVDKCPGQDENDAVVGKIKLDQRISNVDKSWVQFRFAQGSPDKEERFLNALKGQKDNLNPMYPTLFAWHGSRLQNWHSIIRTGLDFVNVQNGRVFGHGVYHAKDQRTSCVYAGGRTGAWPGSELKISSAMSLNEIVNCPDQFRSHTPYLVVQHIDWIQCRYLFVQVEDNPNVNLNRHGISLNSSSASSKSNSLVEILQDPKYTATSTLGKPIGVPLCAVTTSQCFRVDQREGVTRTTPPRKKRKGPTVAISPEAVGASSSASSSASVSANFSASDDGDLNFFISDDDDQEINKVKLNPSLRTPTLSQTDFIPGSLDQSTLPMLQPPSYATPMATKALNRNLKEVVELQKNSNLQELGWYIDPDLISNVYQWIVELHSFDPTIPLSQDMKAAGVTSVVLEIRFGKDYPHTPPFIRVIRPRFLPFTERGGGHVTSGGAMCMELLTNSGWSAVSSIESVLLQVRMAMMNLEPRPARLRSKNSLQRDYGIGEAIDAYRRACHAHGWQIPPDFGDFA